MDSVQSKLTVKVRLPASLVEQLDAHADERQLTRGEVIRRLVERAVSGELATQRALENSIRFVHIAADAVLRDLCPGGVREEVHEAHWSQRAGRRGPSRQG